MKAHDLSPEDRALLDAARQRQAERYRNEPIPPAVAEQILLAIVQQVRRRPALATLALQLLGDLHTSDPSVADALRALLGRAVS